MTLKNIKPITLGLAIITLFAMSHKAHADTTTPYTCPEGGSVYATVNIVPKSPFSAGTPTSFIASGQITSTCSTRLMNLTAQNNSLPLITLISDTSISAGQTYPSIPNTTTFTSPTTAGSYAVHFVTGVEKLSPPPYTVLGSVGSVATSTLACTPGVLSSTARQYFESPTAPPFAVTGVIIYDDYNLTKPFAGNSQWYKFLFNVQTNGGTNEAMQINSSGLVIGHQPCQ